MKKNRNKLVFLTLALLFFASCNVEDFSDLNNPEADAFEQSLSRGDLQDLVGGVLYSMRVRLGTYYDDVGVVGREFWRFSGSEPRFTQDLLGGESAILDNNTFYTTGPWSSRYRTVKNANLILGIVDGQSTNPVFTAAEFSATKGFIKTIKAYELLLTLNLTDENGIRVEVTDENNLGPIVSKTEALAAIRSLLDEGATDLQGGGDSFPFVLTSGFANFDDPGSFLEVNKALAARVAAYQGDFPAILTYLQDSFLDLNGDMSTGIYYVFSEAITDLLNPMFFPVNATTSGARIAQPNFVTDAEAGDSRVNKVVLRPDGPLTFDGLTGDHAVFIYEENDAPIPIIRNEELILLYAEGNIETNPVEAVNALNIIRASAGLPAYGGGTDTASLTQEMLNQRRYSLYAEGHRWIDMRRYDLLGTLPIDRPEDDVWENFPIPLTEN